MSDKGFDNASDACLGRAMAAEWRRMYPTHTDKQLSRDLDCSIAQARSLLAGSLSKTSIGVIIQAYGPDWVAERVFEAANTTLEEYFDQKAEQLEKAAAIAKAKASEARERSQRYKASRCNSLAQDRLDIDPRV